jgi:hypothetical protein
MRSPARALLAAAAVLLAPALAGCGHHVGDKCNTNVDCSPLGDRFCDVASPGGYCTIEGCDIRLNSQNQLVDSCQNVASESICVRFFSPDVSKPCNTYNNGSDCAADERCLCDFADPCIAGVCLESAAAPSCSSDVAPVVTKNGPAHCAKESTERRWCMLKCNQDSDCRSSDGYKCISAGFQGSEPVPRGLVSLPGGDAGFVGVGDFTQKFCIFQGK